MAFAPADTDYCLVSFSKSSAVLFLLLRFISLDSNNLYAYLSKGRLYQFLERNDDAIVMFSKAIDINSKFSISYFNKAQCLEECGMIASARSMMRICLNLNSHLKIYINYYTHLCSVNRTLINI